MEHIIGIVVGTIIGLTIYYGIKWAMGRWDER